MARVLVVDDEENIRIVFHEFLTHDGHDVVTASDASEASALLIKQEFDVVVTDIVMPGFRKRSIRAGSPRTNSNACWKAPSTP